MTPPAKPIAGPVAALNVRLRRCNETPPANLIARSAAALDEFAGAAMTAPANAGARSVAGLDASGGAAMPPPANLIVRSAIVHHGSAYGARRRAEAGTRSPTRSPTAAVTRLAVEVTPPAGVVALSRAAFERGMDVSSQTTDAVDVRTRNKPVT